MGSQSLYPRMPILLTLPVNFSSSGDNTVITAISLTRFAIHRIWLVCAAATSLTFKDGASTALSGAASMSANGGLTFDATGEPWFVTSLGNAFIINSSAAVQVSGMVYYTATT
jgi:hypothetical protein